ncbi:hypothetical protein [Paraglaciecola hydrolytica]|uniref:Uncharacterized protein n=1 Tax=Paraglaciecola hydrolytica TaxID=1799789 RepID=A0A136A085_9ALTE|nr:hypothetical protein [Paraglaciecola hydrolytica]KXI28624.1 hypothetical protein AX660_16190 [Paraglaciecola hydrolytica]
MSWSLIFANLHPVWLVMGLSALILCTGVSIYLASKRLSDQPKRLVLVIALNILASIAVVGLISDIKLNKTQLSQAWLFTTGSLPLSAENQQKLEEQADAKLFVLDDVAALAAEDFSSAHVISEPAQLFDWLPTLQHLTVIGDGLSQTQWQALRSNNPELKIDFIPSTQLSGLVNMRWNKQLQQGEFLEISGQLHIAAQDKNSADLYELNLIDPMGSILAKQHLRSNETFKFKAQPPTTGNWLYQLSLSSKDHDGAALIQENLAVTVQKAKAIKLLIYQSAPSFETRQLREWAGSFANPVTVITQISKNKHLTQHFNFVGQAQTQSEPLTQDKLSQFDLVVMDGRALSLISQPKWIALKQAVQLGLGLLLLADQTLPTALLQHDQQLASKINLSPIAGQGEAQNVVPHWPNSQIEQAIQAQALQLITEPGTNLVMGDQQQGLVSKLNMGLGKIGVSLLNNTHQWQTSGLATQYSSYWQYLFKSFAANRHSAIWLPQSAEDLLLLNQASAACVLSQTTNPLVQLQNSNNSAALKLYLVADTLQQGRYCASYWPQHLGWQQLNLVSNESDSQSQTEISPQQNQYVYAENDWQAWQQQQKHQASAYQAKLSNSFAQPQPIEHRSPLSKLWFWLLWLVCCSVLWVERKTF